MRFTAGVLRRVVEYVVGPPELVGRSVFHQMFLDTQRDICTL